MGSIDFFPSLDEIHHCLCADFMAVDTNALSEVEYMRRRVESGPVTAPLEYGSEGMCCRSLAVGPCNVDSRVAVVWITEYVIKSHRCGESGLVGARSDVVKHRQGVI